MNIYKIEDTETGKYYIGMNRTDNENYYGSGVWIKEQAKIISKLKRMPNSAKANHFEKCPNRFKKTILFTTEDENELYEMKLGSVNALCNGQIKTLNGWKIETTYTIKDRIENNL